MKYYPVRHLLPNNTLAAHCQMRTNPHKAICMREKRSIEWLRGSRSTDTTTHQPTIDQQHMIKQQRRIGSVENGYRVR